MVTQVERTGSMDAATVSEHRPPGISVPFDYNNIFKTEFRQSDFGPNFKNRTFLLVILPHYFHPKVMKKRQYPHQ